MVSRKTYGVRSLFKDFKSNLAQAIVAEKEGAYLIAQSLRSDLQLLS